MFNPKVSVIIPVYTASQYLEKCLNSIVAQTLKDIEIIIVNDCSPDPLDDNICQNFANKDRRVVYVKHTKNIGPGGARNTGIKIARAHYIGFVDCDDFIDPKMFQVTYEEAITNDRDIVIFGYSLVDYDSKLISKNIPKGDTEGDLLKNFLDSKNTMNPSLWNKLWKKSLFLDNSIDLTLANYCDDIIAVPQLLYFAKNIVFLEQSFYNYLKNEESVIHSFSRKYVDDIFIVLSSLTNFLISIGKLSSHSESLNNMFWSMIRYHIETGLEGASYDEKKEVLSYLGERSIAESLPDVSYYFPQRYY